MATAYEVHVYALRGSASSSPLTGECTTADSKWETHILYCSRVIFCSFPLLNGNHNLIDYADITPPRRVRITDVKDTSFTLTWRVVNNEPMTGFLIEATPKTGGHPTFRQTIPADSRTYIVTGRLQYNPYIAPNRPSVSTLMVKLYLLKK